jgi:hypothetical protein
VLVFEKAGHHVRVVLNGTTVGEHYGVRLPFSFDVTEALREGAENELVVWAAPADVPNARPGGVGSADEAKAYDVFLVGEPSGWYPAGIFGDVVLRLVPAVRVEDAFVRTSVREGTIAATLDVANHGDTAASVTVQTGVVTLDGAPTTVHLPDETITLAPGGRASIERSGSFQDARHWPDGGATPPLYVLRASIVRDGLTEDLVTHRFGFRELWTEGRDLVLNGRRLGIVADLTTSITGRQRLTHLFDALHGVGVNAVHPHWDDGTQSFYDLADETGMLVVPELYCAGPFPFTRRVVAPATWAEEMEGEYEAWVRLRRSHPSIVLWSPYDFPPGGIRQTTLDAFVGRVRSEDPTRPILGRDVLKASIGNAHEFVADPRNANRLAYETQLATSRDDGRPLLVPEIVKLADATPDEIRVLLARFGADGIVGFGGLLLEKDLFQSRGLVVEWPSPSGPDGRPPGSRTIVRDVVNWSDPTRPTVMRTPLGRLVRRLAPKALGTTAAPLSFVRSPELLVVGPASCGSRGIALAAPMSGAGGIERATLLDPAGKGWILLSEPGTYRVRIACDEARETTVDAPGRPFTSTPGFGHLQEVRLDATP